MNDTKFNDLVAKFVAAGVQPEDLDEAVYTLAEVVPNDGPSNINNGGLEEQIKFLMTNFNNEEDAYRHLEAAVQDFQETGTFDIV